MKRGLLTSSSPHCVTFDSRLAFVIKGTVERVLLYRVAAAHGHGRCLIPNSAGNVKGIVSRACRLLRNPAFFFVAVAVVAQWGYTVARALDTGSVLHTPRSSL